MYNVVTMLQTALMNLSREYIISVSTNAYVVHVANVSHSRSTRRIVLRCLLERVRLFEYLFTSLKRHTFEVSDEAEHSVCVLLGVIDFMQK